MKSVKVQEFKGDRSPSYSGSEDKDSAAKVAKITSEGGASTCTIENGEPTWSLGGMKSVKVQEFKGKTYVDIREYYIDKSTMETKPGTKGIKLNCEDYQKLKTFFSEIDQKLP